MSAKRRVTLDANEAVASVAHRASEVIAIYPITPSSPMGELADAWSEKGQPNLWGKVPKVVEMQSEGGAAGAVHGALQAGALATTFTASQGLLLMIPNMYKIAGELTPFAMHVAARTLATHALSIFGDHSDVMACRQTGFALLASGSVQEAQDLAAIAHAATLSSRIPFLHFFDGFRTSHEVAKIEQLTDEELTAMIDAEDVAAHRRRALTPDRPVLRGTAQNPDAFFQAREAGNPFYLACPDDVERAMQKFAAITGRRYRLFDYVGDPQATHVVVLMGSAAETAHETVEWLLARGGKVGVLKVRLYRPFDVARFVAALPSTVEAIAVLDRTKEPGSIGEPLYQDVVTAFHERDGGRRSPRVVGGRYGLSSKELTPAMLAAVFEELSRESPRNHFTLGITDDVTKTSLPYDAALDIEPPDTIRAVFYGLGSDGTVGRQPQLDQDPRRRDRGSCARLLRLRLEEGRRDDGFAPALRTAADPLGLPHRPGALRRLPPVRVREPLRDARAGAAGAAFLLNSPYGPDEVWDHLPREVQEQMVEKRIRFFVIDAYKIARDAGLKGRINTIMQTCFFAIVEPLPQARAIARIKEAVEETYAKKGPEVLRRNFAAIDATLAGLSPVTVPAR